jgi:bacillithiol biosynthesis cysteine-adding enzyme BshC
MAVLLAYYTKSPMEITSLPNFTPLVKDYLTRFADAPIREFFPIAPDAPQLQMRHVIDARLARENALAPAHRATVVNSIRAYHESLGEMSAATTRNIELLKSPDALAIVTGQQAGMLGGPLYTFYKAFTAIELASSLRERFTGLSFVPIFWMETEDHDLEEILPVNVLNTAGRLESIRYVPAELAANPDVPWRKQAGPTLLEEAPLAEFFEKLRSILQPTDFSAEVLGLMQQVYAPGRSFAQAFASLLLHYFAEDGLLIIDANSKELKSLSSDIFRQEIETSPQLSEQIVLRSAKVEEAYHAQIKPRTLNLFYVDKEGDRIPIVEKEKSSGTEREFFTKGSHKTFTYPELLLTLDEHPERFSPNVVTRPLYQDSLLPTVAYVAGPGELAYFAQLGPAYEWAALPMPLIHPRVTVTVVEERLERIFTKFNIAPEDVLSDVHGKNTALFDAMIESELIPHFERVIEETDRTLESLREKVTLADPTLDGALTSLKGKVLTTVRDFEGKTLSAERKRHATTKAQLDKLLAALLPAGELQERELNLVYFLNKYGPRYFKALKLLLQPIALDFRAHHVLHLKNLTPYGM